MKNIDIKILVIIITQLVSYKSSAFDGKGVNSQSSNFAQSAWSGFYAGFNIGGGFDIFSPISVASVPFSNYSYAGDILANNLFPERAIYGSSNNIQRGIIGGGQFGINKLLTSTTFIGAVLDFEGSMISGVSSHNSFDQSVSYNNAAPLETYTAVGNASIQKGLNWVGTIRGKLGYNIKSDLMVYPTVGIAFGDAFLKTHYNINISEIYINQANENFGNSESSSSFNKKLIGFTGGIGAEWLFAKDTGVLFEALYHSFGNKKLTSFPIVSVVDNVNTVGLIPTVMTNYNYATLKIGINYHFK